MCPCRIQGWAHRGLLWLAFLCMSIRVRATVVPDIWWMFAVMVWPPGPQVLRGGSVVAVTTKVQLLKAQPVRHNRVPLAAEY